MGSILQKTQMIRKVSENGKPWCTF
uniref:Uncharacterized protein n=1 Tax=Rhizophora mucronata TaxID=61149 RepID=A0A2P2NF16_RHIMU